MRFACDSCGAQYMIADEKVGPRGVKVKCKKCSNMIVVKPQAAAAQATEGATVQASAPVTSGQGGELGGAFQSMFTSGAPSPDAGGYGGSTTTYSAAQLRALQQEASQQSESESAPSGQSEAPSQAPSQSTSSFDSGGSFAPSSFDSGSAAPSDSDAQAAFGASSFGSSSFGSDAFASSPAPSSASTNGSTDSGSTDNAFGFPSAPHTSGETDLAIGALGRAQQPAAPSGRPAGEKEWYVAIDDAQVGPISITEIEEKWDAKEIDAESLVWKGGLADWLPLADVPDFAYLITERPQQTRPAAQVAAAASGSAGASVGTGLSAASFAQSQDIPAEPSWRPSAASALSSLVQEELVTKKPEKEDAPTSTVPKGMEGLGLPSMGAADIFGGGSGTPINLNTPSAPSAPDPFASSGTPAWSVPESGRSGDGHHGLKYAVIALIIVLLGGMGGFGFLFIRGQQQQADMLAKQMAQAPQAAPTPAPQPAAAAPAPTAQPGAVAAAPTAADPAGTTAPAPVAAADPTPREKAKAKGVREDREKDPPPTKVVTKTKSKEKDPLDEIDSAAEKPAVSDKDLTKDDIVNGVRTNGAKLGPCLTSARSKNEVQPGKITFVLDWTIQPTGAVTGAKLKGPAEVMGTSLPACFGRVMGSWRFPPSKKGAPVANFPLPITVR